MPLVYIKRYTREYIRNRPHELFVFGDNFARSGYGGQAHAARDEPNAVGIITKIFPGWMSTDYLSDEHLPPWREHNMKAFALLSRAVEDGVTVHWPADGIGTGRAGQLDRRAPRIWAELEAFRLELERLSDRVAQMEKAPA